MKESESEVLKIEESESELLCTDSTALSRSVACGHFRETLLRCLFIDSCCFMTA
jgi:hypothetical protein